MQYTIEAHKLTNDTAFDADPKRVVIEAATLDDAITRFLSDNDSELVSVTRPLRGSESIATVRKNESVFLVRVYAA